MAQTSKTSVRRKTTAVLAVFFLGNVLLAVFALATVFGGRPPMELLPEDAGAAVKAGAALLGIAMAWFLGRWLYLQMLYGDFRPDESATGAMALTLYVMLLFAGAVFAGAALWEWLVFLLVVIVLIILLALRAVIGTMMSAAVILLSLAAGGVLYALLTV